MVEVALVDVVDGEAVGLEPRHGVIRGAAVYGHPFQVRLRLAVYRLQHLFQERAGVQRGNYQAHPQTPQHVHCCRGWL